ncbi:hypothetical protein ABTY59_20460 [Streptomyces sp. NPDC096079]|uniref:hypothetical protein n=1 Tax=unclassified Streptomyces TaxID=2593676 RepID=UPI003332BAED
MDNSLRDMGCGLTLLLILFGSVTLWRGVTDLRDGTTISCMDRRMGPGDTCVMRAGSNVVRYTYEEKADDWDNATPALATGVGGTVLVGSVALGVWLILRQGDTAKPSRRRGSGAEGRADTSNTGDAPP